MLLHHIICILRRVASQHLCMYPTTIDLSVQPLLRLMQDQFLCKLPNHTWGNQHTFKFHRYLHKGLTRWQHRQLLNLASTGALRSSI